MTDDPESPETWIRDGEVWIPDGPALAKRLGASYLYFLDGELWAGIAGDGDDLVRNLLAKPAEPDRPKLASVKSIK